jgi:hypothetical protein
MFQFFEFYLCFAIPSPVSSAEHSLFFFFRPPPLSCYTCTCYHLAGDKGNEMYTNHTDVMFIGVRRFEDVRLIGTASCGSWEWHGVWGEQELAGWRREGIPTMIGSGDNISVTWAMFTGNAQNPCWMGRVLLVGEAPVSEGHVPCGRVNLVWKPWGACEALKEETGLFSVCFKMYGLQCAERMGSGFLETSGKRSGLSQTSGEEVLMQDSWGWGWGCCRRARWMRTCDKCRTGVCAEGGPGRCESVTSAEQWGVCAAGGSGGCEPVTSEGQYVCCRRAGRYDEPMTNALYAVLGLHFNFQWP